MPRYSYIFLILFVSVNIWAEDFNPSTYKKGTGSKFLFKMAGNSAEVEVYIVDSSPKNLSFEFNFKSPYVQMWQQYELGQGASNKLKINNGYIYASQTIKPQKLTREYLSGYDGVTMESFLISSSNDLKKKLIGVESITVEGGTIQKAQHFQTSENGQTIDFWISDSLKPIGIVKVKSSGKKIDHNYELEFAGSLINSDRKIDPAQAIPLNDLGKSYLPKPGSPLFMH